MKLIVCVLVSGAVITKTLSSSLSVKLDSETCGLAGMLVLKVIQVKQGGPVHSLGCNEPGKLLARHISFI